VYHTYKWFANEGHKEIMLTGGEPTRAKKFWAIVELAKNIFDKVHLTTQEPLILEELWAEQFDTITFSLHDDSIPKNQLKKPKVYASILGDKYSDKLAMIVKGFGYDGMTINEEHREKVKFTNLVIPMPNFSYKINRIGHCMDEYIILQDLFIIKDFRPYL